MHRDAVTDRSPVEPGSSSGVNSIVAPDISPEDASFVYRNYFKRVLDVVFVLLILPIVVLPLAILYLVVRKDGGPFLYGQDRIGRDGKLFRCYKIRSMVVGADQKLAALLESDPELRREWDEHFKLKNDPRISAVGRILRKTSLDEIPQLLNVLKGDMSLVGPRPIVQGEVEKYGPLVQQYVKVKPGLTGPWQIHGRRDNDYTNRAQMDAEYVRNVSLMRDIYIIFATVPEVLLGHGK